MDTTKKVIRKEVVHPTVKFAAHKTTILNGVIA